MLKICYIINNLLVKGYDYMNRIDVNMVSRCTRCADISKINIMKIDNDTNELILEYICDCGNIHKETVKINFV